MNTTFDSRPGPPPSAPSAATRAADADLLDDLGGGQVAGEAALAGGAERAGHAAAGLAGDAHRDPFARAVRGVVTARVAHEHALDLRAVVQPPEGLAGRAGVGLQRAHLVSRAGSSDVAQPVAHAGRQVGHRRRVGLVPREVVPRQLIGAVGRQPELDQGRAATLRVEVGEVGRGQAAPGGVEDQRERAHEPLQGRRRNALGRPTGDDEVDALARLLARGVGLLRRHPGLEPAREPRRAVTRQRAGQPYVTRCVDPDREIPGQPDLGPGARHALDDDQRAGPDRAPVATGVAVPVPDLVAREAAGQQRNRRPAGAGGPSPIRPSRGPLKSSTCTTAARGMAAATAAARVVLPAAPNPSMPTNAVRSVADRSMRTAAARPPRPAPAVARHQTGANPDSTR